MIKVTIGARLCVDHPLKNSDNLPVEFIFVPKNLFTLKEYITK